MVDALSRAWPSPGLWTDVSETLHTYVIVPYESLPHVIAPNTFDWLVPPSPRVVVARDNTNPAQVEHLISLAERAGRKLPVAFVDFFRSHELRQRVPTYTSCYFELDEELETLADGSRLLRFLSDQQDSIFWFLRLGMASSDIVAGCPEGGEEADEHPGVPLRFNLTTCADSFEEFIYRFWLENSISFALSNGQQLTSTEQAYLTAVRAAEESQAQGRRPRANVVS